MVQATLANLGTLVRNHRGNKTLRDAAGEIGVGHATLLRVESGRVPDVETFGKICKWLGRDPGEFLGFHQNKAATGDVVRPTSIGVHLRANAAQLPETVAVLAKMMLLATQRQKPSVDPDAET